MAAHCSDGHPAVPELVLPDCFILGSVTVAFAKGVLEKMVVTIPPDMYTLFASIEDIFLDYVVLAMLDRNSIFAECEVIKANQGVSGVTCPDSPFAVEECIVNEDVPIGERRLDTVHDGIREIVPKDEISVAPALAGMHERFVARIEEESVSAVSGAVVGKKVVAALLVHEDSGGVLPAGVDTVAVAADAEIEMVSDHAAEVRSPHGQSPTRHERHVIVFDNGVVGADDAEAVLAVSGAVVDDVCAVTS